MTYVSKSKVEMQTEGGCLRQYRRNKGTGAMKVSKSRDADRRDMPETVQESKRKYGYKSKSKVEMQTERE